MPALALLVLLPALASAQQGGHFGGVPDAEPPEDAALLAAGQAVAPQPVHAPSPSLPDLVLHADAIVRARGLERSGEWLRLPVTGWLWGKGPGELFVRDAAFAPEVLQAGAAGEWVVFLGQGAGSMSAIAALDGGVVPLDAHGRRPPAISAPLPLERGVTLQRIGQLLAVRRHEADLGAWIDGLLREPPSLDDALLAAQAAALEVQPAAAPFAGPDVARLAVMRLAGLVGELDRVTGQARGTGAGAALDALIDHPDGAWRLALERLATQAPPAALLGGLAPDPAQRPYARALGQLERRLALAVLDAAVQRLAADGRPIGRPAEPLTRGDLREWLAGWRLVLLQQDLAFAQAALLEGGPANVQAAVMCIAPHTGWEVQLDPQASRADRQALLQAFREWCGEQAGR